MVDGHDHDQDPELPVTEPRPRRRRAASRPAGPPVHVDAAEQPALPGADGTEPSAPAGEDDESTPEESGDAIAAESDESAQTDDEAAETSVESESADEPVQAEGQAAEPGDAVATESIAPEPTPAPEPKRRSRRATRGVTTVAFSAEPTSDVTTAAAPPPVDAAPLALFQPPDETKAVRQRRRSRGTAPEQPAPASDAEGPELGEAVAEAEAEPAAERPEPTDDELSSASLGDSENDESADDENAPRRRRRRGGRRRRRAGQGGGEQDASDESSAESAEDGEASAEPAESEDGDVAQPADAEQDANEESGGSKRRRRRRRRAGVAEEMEDLSSEDPANTVVKVREGRRTANDEITSVRGSTRIEAKKQRRRDGRDAGRRRPPILTEAEFLARRESVNRVMCVREHGDRTQIAVLEDGILVEHYVNRHESSSMVGNVYLGKVQNVLPSMEAAFVDIGRGRNAVLYAGEVNWEAAGLEGQPKRIELALKSGDPVLVQVTKDPIGHKGARLTSQISLPGRFLVYVPEGSMTGISRKLPDTERARLKGILKDVVPEGAGVIVRTAAEGATEEQLTSDVQRLTKQWTDITKKSKTASAPALLYGEPDLAIKVVRDIFNEDFTSLIVQGEEIGQTLHDYIERVAPDLVGRLVKWVEPTELYAANRIDEQLAKALDRKVWLPSGGSLVIDRTEAMTVVDVNTGKFTGQGGNLEETVTRNNLEAAEEIVRQLRLRDIGGIIVIDFIDMVLESNRDLVLRRLVECLGRDRTKHQVAEVTSLGLVQMTRKRIGQGLLEVFSTPCEACGGRGHLVSTEPVGGEEPVDDRNRRGGDRERGARKGRQPAPVHLGGKQTGKTPPPPKFDEFGHIDHSEEASHEAPVDASAVDESVEPDGFVEAAESSGSVDPVELAEPADGGVSVDSDHESTDDGAEPAEVPAEESPEPIAGSEEASVEPGPDHGEGDQPSIEQAESEHAQQADEHASEQFDAQPDPDASTDSSEFAERPHQPEAV